MLNKLKSKILIRNTRNTNTEAGMTLLEIVVAILVLNIGLLAATTTVVYALQTNSFSRNSTESKMYASAMLEQVETLRNTGQLTFKQIANTNEQINPPPPARQFSGFPTDFRQIAVSPGLDGIFGTIDDDVNTIEDSKSQYTRQILITNINPTLKRIEVSIRQPGFQGGIRTMTMVSYLNDNERSNQQN